MLQGYVSSACWVIVRESTSTGRLVNIFLHFPPKFSIHLLILKTACVGIYSVAISKERN